MSAHWQDIVKDWELVPVESYKLLFSQAKDRYDEVMSESESISNKAITLTTVTVAALSGFVSKLITIPNMGLIVLLFFLFAANFICLGKLLFPKQIIQRGSPPKETFVDYLDEPSLDAEEKTRLVYYHELRRYQERIDIMETRLGARHLFYGIALCLTILVTVGTAGVILSTIYRP